MKWSSIAGYCITVTVLLFAYFAVAMLFGYFVFGLVLLGLAVLGLFAFDYSCRKAGLK